MYDINKFIANPRMETSDPEGHLAELPHWSPRVAAKRAEEEGIELQEAHWEVVYCLRERFRLLGPEWTARRVGRELDKEYAEAGGSRYLYELFPRGPLRQACHIAGLPLPQGTVNLSFGSVH